MAINTNRYRQSQPNVTTSYNLGIPSLVSPEAQYEPYLRSIVGSNDGTYMPMPLNYDAGGPPQWQVKPGEEDPYQLGLQDRTWALDRGGRLDQDLRDDEQMRRGQEVDYRGYMDSAYRGLAGTPGYTQDEQGNIVRSGDLNNLGVTQNDINGWQYTDGEQAGIYGEPNKQYGWFNPAATEGIANEATGRANGALDGWGNAGRAAWSGMADNTQTALNNPALGMSNAYTDGQDRYLGEGATGIRGASSNPNLGLSSEYNAKHQFTPEDEQNMITSAALGVGSQTRANQDRVARAAGAAGMNSPLALAASLNNLQRTGDINAQDAMLNARIGAKQLGLNVAQQHEDTRLGAEGNRASLRMQGEGAIMNAGLGATQGRENTRIGAQQWQTGQDVANQQRLGTSLMGLESDLGQAGVNNAWQGGQQRQQANQYNQNLGVDIARNVDQNATARAAQLANNRQQTSMQGQDMRYGQGMGVSNALSQRNQTTADARRQGESEYRGWATGQTNGAVQNQQSARQQRVGLFGTQASAQNNATHGAQGVATSRDRTGFANSFTNSLGGALGGFLGSGGGR